MTHQLHGLAANPALPPELVDRLIAEHPHATGPALRLCLADAKARRYAAAHPALPAAELPGLLDDPDWQVVEAAAAHPSLPLAVMRELMP
ncbi:hypothetical protein ACWDYJ_28100 [Streptomyces sp. NPDC003042]